MFFNSVDRLRDIAAVFMPLPWFKRSYYPKISSKYRWTSYEIKRSNKNFTNMEIVISCLFSLIYIFIFY